MTTRVAYRKKMHKFFHQVTIDLRFIWTKDDRFCGLVVRVPGYRSRGSVFDSRCYEIF
jgi:hypothetical protein